MIVTNGHEKEEDEEDDEEKSDSSNGESEESDNHEDLEEDDEFNAYTISSTNARDQLLINCINNAAVVLTKSRNIAHMAKKSSLINSKVKSLVKRNGIKRGKTFLSDFRIRWNSSVIMLQRMQKLKQVVKDLSSVIIDGLKKTRETRLRNACEFSNNEWETLDSRVSILKPFYETTKILSGKYPTLSLSFLVYKFLKSFLLSQLVDTDDSTLEYLISEKLLDKLEYHFKNKLSKGQVMVRLVSDINKNRHKNII